MLTLQPIGFVRTGKHAKFQALHQPAESAQEQHILELVPGQGYENGLRDLTGFSRIWLIWWFHKNDTWRPMVLPPRGPAIRRGVFATRSPHRPNFLGMTPVQLLAIEKNRLLLGPCDLVDGTPVFDIKPYIPAYDSFPDERSGWTGEVDAGLAAPPAFAIEWSPLAHDQAEWLAREWHVDFRPRLEELLGRDPSPHRTRRIKKRPDGQFQIGCGGWLADFAVLEKTVHIIRIDPGYPARLLEESEPGSIPDHAAQLAFLKHWGSTRDA
ncbi:MAG: tsaA [Verrucomicrobiales bacterium]|nr:tsaA [Verrucomicrobiales bacterium]